MTANAMSEEIRLNLQNEIKNEPLEEINSGHSIFFKPEPADCTNANVKVESEDLHHSIDIKEEILEAEVVDGNETEKYEEESSETTSRSESNSSDAITDTGSVHRKRKIRIDDPSNRYYEYKLLKLYQRIEHQRSLFDIKQKIHQKTMERLKLDLQHQNEIFKLDEKIQKTANKINELKKLKK